MTATIEPAAKVAQAHIPTEFRMKWRSQIMREHDVAFVEADWIISDTLSFLTVGIANPSTSFRPSQKVDIGWHQFILNTREYAEFCDREAGYFIHHVPDEFTAPRRKETDVPGVLAPTVEAITNAGLPLHPELWLSGGERCSQCHSGCTSCGQGDDPH
ncbi:glycine-rich domain-containing protein [Lentzea sp. NPDC059081]|uniref:glycine-rich domain-containing protein n=1 Tax=Lentzea sp. NPDC059081 TaxID=3346719 RepID=UPI0036BBD628